MNGKEFGEELADMVKLHIERQMAPLLKRLELAEGQIKAGQARIKTLEGRAHG